MRRGCKRRRKRMRFLFDCSMRRPPGKTNSHRQSLFLLLVPSSSRGGNDENSTASPERLRSFSWGALRLFAVAAGGTIETHRDDFRPPPARRSGDSPISLRAVRARTGAHTRPAPTTLRASSSPFSAYPPRPRRVSFRCPADGLLLSFFLLLTTSGVLPSVPPPPHGAPQLGTRPSAGGDGFEGPWRPPPPSPCRGKGTSERMLGPTEQGVGETSGDTAF